ncbi:hypothetical protein FPE01S_03_05430 [Flavihumibacter petaseus NBRC 106054]|uniref:DNA-binding protein n=2 Tax=Flavihumibacter TaxID=1004301 RepID=A0A0E9N4C0_9BACT|nr:hypothetical protein FPE01S_03_05430 [Flavihumibacter petaseus NBRC 106054]
MAKLSAPARRALENAGITTLEALSAWSAEKLLALHGIGPSTIPRLEAAFSEAGLKWVGR